MKKFLLTYSGSATLSIEELWPDGDAPENPTEEDVLELIEDCGGPEAILRDWSMDEMLALDVTELGVKPPAQPPEQE